MPEGHLGVTALAGLGSGSWGQLWALGRFGNHSLERRGCVHSEQVTGGAGTPSAATRTAPRMNNDECRSLAQRGLDEHCYEGLIHPFTHSPPLCQAQG